LISSSLRGAIVEEHIRNLSRIQVIKNRALNLNKDYFVTHKKDDVQQGNLYKYNSKLF